MGYGGSGVRWVENDDERVVLKETKGVIDRWSSILHGRHQTLTCNEMLMHNTLENGPAGIEGLYTEMKRLHKERWLGGQHRSVWMRYYLGDG